MCKGICSCYCKQSKPNISYFPSKIHFPFSPFELYESIKGENPSSNFTIGTYER